MKFLLEKFLALREVFAISMFVCGLPIIYYLRDGLGVLPNNAITTVFGVLGPLVAALLFKKYNKIYMPNKVGYFLAIWFLVICFMYLFFRDQYTWVKGPYEYFNITFTFFIFIAILFISEKELNRQFLPVFMAISLIGCVFLLYYVATNPLFIIGQRATIVFKNENGESSGNPHIYSRVGYFGIILSCLMLKYQSRFKLNIVFSIAFLFIFLAVIFLTQTVIAMLATFLFVVLFLFFNFNAKVFGRSILSLTLKWYVLIVLIFGTYKVTKFLNENEDVLTPITSYLSGRFERITKSIFSSSDKKSKSDDADVSATNRVELVTGVFDRMKDNYDEGKFRYILWGNGYKFMYIDVPIIEVLDSFGFILFMFYVYFFYYMLKLCLKEMRNPSSIAAEFIAYGFIYYFILNFSGGLMIDYVRWGYFALVCRFVGVSTIKAIVTRQQV
jgi:hypothetical protein